MRSPITILSTMLLLSHLNINNNNNNNHHQHWCASAQTTSMQPSGSPSLSAGPSLSVSPSVSSQPSSRPTSSEKPSAAKSATPTQNPSTFVKANDVCVDALITPPNGAHQAVDLAKASPDPTANGGACDGATIGETPGVWFAVEGTGQTLRASTCHPETEIKVRITLFGTLDSSCNTLQCKGVTTEPDFECPMTTLSSQTANDAQWSSPSTKVDFPTVKGLKYYLLVQQDSVVVQSGKVSFSIRPVASPEHDDCVDALGPMPRNGIMVEQPNLDASFSKVLAGYCSSQPSRYPGVWYQMIGNGGNVDLSACALNNFEGFLFSVYEGGNCDDLKCIDGVQSYRVEDDAECFFLTSADGEAATGAQRSKFQATVPTVDGRRYYVYLHYSRTEQDTVTTDRLRFSVKDAVGAPTSQYGHGIIKFRDSVYGMGSYVPGKTNRKNFLEDSTNRRPNNSGGAFSVEQEKLLRSRAAAVATLLSFALVVVAM